MKILMVNSVCGIGSTGRICTDLYDVLVLEEQGNECVIAYGRGTADTKYNTYKIGNKLDNYMHVFNSRMFDSHGFSSKKATKKFVAFIREYSPDVIHIHNVHGYYLNIEIFFKYLKDEYNGKIIWTMHDCWAFSPHSAYIDYDENKKLPKSESRKNIKKYPKSLFINNSKKNFYKKKKIFSEVNSLTIVTPSNWLQGMISDSFLSEYDCKTINNGIDIKIFNPPHKKEVDKSKKIILGVANIWEPRKGLKIFNELADILNTDYKIKLVGKLNGNQLNKKILHVEQTSNVNELAQIYKDSYLFVNPTYEDNYPTTNLEAIASGLPIVLFDTGGNKEMIFENKGILTNKKNSKSVKDAIECIEKNKDYKYPSKEFLKNISKKRMLNDYIKLY